MPEGEKPKHVTPAHTWKCTKRQRQKQTTTAPGCLLVCNSSHIKSESYPVLLVLLLVFCVSVHVGAHTGVARCAGDAADAVRGVLPPDAQVWLLILLLMLLTAVTAC